MRYAVILALSLALCFTVQSLALRSYGSPPKSESNYFSSLGRIQLGVRGNPDVMVLGSSITGRLPDRAQGFKGWANMGCDGGSAVDALRAMDASILPTSPWLVIEANTLHMPLEANAVQVADSMHGVWFQLGLKVPLIAADARPASFLYSKLLTRKIGGFGTTVGSDDLGTSSQPEVIADIPNHPLKPSHETLVVEVCSLLARLRDKGSEAVIVWLPPARQANDFRLPLVLEIARRSGVPFWDLGQVAAPGTVQFTDGVHMTPESAVRTMHSLRKVIAR